MNNKLSSLCMIATLLLGTTSANAAYYYYRSQPMYQVVTVNTCSTCNVCNTCQVKKHCPCSAKKHYHHKVSHHPKYYYASPHPVVRSHYSISTYYVYGTPCGQAIWVPSCQNGCVTSQEYHDAFYGPYYPAGVTPADDDDFDMDTRTADDVYDEY